MENHDAFGSAPDYPKKKLLWLVSWYPNESDPFSGDFIKRQAEAVSIYQPLNVLWVGKYTPKYFSEKIENVTIEFKMSNLKEYILYYPAMGKGDNIFSKIQSFLKYLKKNKEFIRQLRKKNELPDIVHVQVAMKAGLIALYMKWKYKIPYVLTEHWSGYYPHAKDNLFDKSFLIRYLTKRILKNAARFLPVSESLGNQISRYWTPIAFQKIPNVVNTRFFFPSSDHIEKRFRFIHISSMLYPKNPEAIIRSFDRLLKQGIEAELVLVGPLNPSINKFIQSIGPSTIHIQCTGEISYEQVAIELRKASSLILFSFYETMSCVVIEALCTGIPVISSCVGGIPEVIQNDNGILIQSGDENELLEGMKNMIRQYHIYDKNKISKRASEQFSYETIGQKIIQVYNSVLENN